MNIILYKQDNTKQVMLTFSTILLLMLQTQSGGTEVQYRAVLGDLFVFRQQTWPELSNSPDIVIYDRPRLLTLDWTELRQDRDYDVLQAQWTKGMSHIVVHSTQSQDFCPPSPGALT